MFYVIIKTADYISFILYIAWELCCRRKLNVPWSDFIWCSSKICEVNMLLNPFRSSKEEPPKINVNCLQGASTKSYDTGIFLRMVSVWLI